MIINFATKLPSMKLQKSLAARKTESPFEINISLHFNQGLPINGFSPFTDDVLKALPQDNKKNVLVFSPAFTADCLETIIEIGDEYKELFYESGGTNLDYVPSLNFSDKWVDAIVDITNMNEGDSDKNV